MASCKPVLLLFDLDQRHSFILVCAVRSGHGNSGVFALVSAELTEVGEILVHVEQGVIPRNRIMLPVTERSVHPPRNVAGDMPVVGVQVHFRCLVADVVLHGHRRGQRCLQELAVHFEIRFKCRNTISHY
jgi:hypothetical protein